MSTITISTVTLLEVLLGGVVIGLSAWVFTGAKPSPSGSPPGALDNTSSAKKTKSKKKKGTTTAPEPTPADKASSPPPPQPAQAPKPAPTPAPTSTEPSKKKKKAKGINGAGGAPPAGSTPAPTAPSSVSSSTPSFAAVAAPGPTSTSTPPAISTSISRSRSPQPRSPVIKANNKMRPPESAAASGTADMVEKDDLPAPARVMRVMGGKLGALPPVGDWEDWHTREDEDNGWEVATKAKKPTKSTMATSGYSPSFAASNPAPAARSIPGLSASDQASLTKKQQQNQAKKARAAAEKEDQERDRLARLAEHRRQLEQARAAEAERARTKNAPKKGGPRSEHVGPARKLTNHGQSAQIDSNGHLIWD